MNLKDEINEDLKSAMKSGDKLRLETIRSIRALILEFEKSGKDKVLTSEEEIKMLNGAVKKRRDSIEQFNLAGRTELAQKEEAELKILMSYMPKQLSSDEVYQEVKRIAEEINAIGKEDFPKLMSKAAQLLKGKADGKLVKTLVDKYLGII
ncbi:MAG: GatB/YqeY domain-containing protein [Ignavibacteriaceae bacterium]|nr:GatB/YqeY domain-containing protein [Ignavibacteriaceae bacterium]